MNYYQRLKDMREDRDLTQAEIAEVIGTKQSDYSKYELGKHMMGIDKYIALAKFYNVSIDYLAGLTDKPKTLDGKPYSAKSYNIKQKGNITNNFN